MLIGCLTGTRRSDRGLGMMFRSFSALFRADSLALVLLSFAVTGTTVAQQDAGQPSPQVAPANPSGLAIPRWVSIGAKNGEANLRTGPGDRYPIDWVLQRRNLPVEVVGEFENWRQIQVQDGTVGWVHKSMLSGRRTATVVDARVRMREDPDDDAPVVAFIEAGAVVSLRDCETTWCRVTIASHGVGGWIPREMLWGLYDGEDVGR